MYLYISRCYLTIDSNQFKSKEELLIALNTWNQFPAEFCDCRILLKDETATIVKHFDSYSIEFDDGGADEESNSMYTCDTITELIDFIS